MIDSVEEFFEIEIDHDVVALGDITLRLSHCLMGGAPRSKAVTVLGERRVPPLLENLQHSLLNQSVDDARHAELSDPAVRLGDFDPFDRLWLIGSLKQLSPQLPIYGFASLMNSLRRDWPLLLRTRFHVFPRDSLDQQMSDS